MIAAYLLDPAEARYALEELLDRYAGARLPSDDGPAEGELDFGGDGIDVGQLAARRALAVDRLVVPLSDALDARGLRALDDEIEVPLVRVLARMEIVGVGVDVDELRRLSERAGRPLRRAAGPDLDRRRRGVQRELHREAARDPLRPASASRPQKKTKTGYSTDASSLEKLKGQHPIIEHLLAYREVEKLRSTYGEGLLAEVARRRPHPRHVQPDRGPHRAD